MYAKGARYSQRREMDGRLWKKRARLTVAGAVLVIALAAPGFAPAAVFPCPAGDVACLIDAINTANGNGEADTILLEAGAYTLTAVDNDTDGPNGLPSITTSIAIQGAGPAATILQRDPALGTIPPMEPLFRILHVSASGTLTLDALTIRNGIVDVFSSGGGGILNNGTVLLTGSRVEDNACLDLLGGGIQNGGTLSISQSTISGNHAGPTSLGGGLSNHGSASITNSAITGNSSGTGGGIANLGGTLTLENSTISGNISTNGGGGGIYLRDGTVGLNNSTIADNMLGPAGVGEGGGIHNEEDEGGTVELQNTILALNSADDPFGEPGTGPDCSGSITSLGNNLVGDPSDCTIALLASDLTGDPGLDAFADDGTPGKGHFPLLETSQAVDAGDPASCTPTDQLGHFRIDGDGDDAAVCDIGAIEFFPDADGDGIPDPLDACADSDLAPTVMIGGCDSGVANTVSPDGCTIADLISKCASEAGNHGAFVSCVSHEMNDLKKDGVISGGEKDSIQTCAAGAPIP